jgi:hypothetical protein
VVERPVVERPVVERPVVERPVVERPVVAEPVPAGPASGSAAGPGRPAAGWLPDSHGAVPGCLPRGRCIAAKPLPSVWLLRSRRGSGGDQPPASSIAAQVCVTVSSADGSLVASSE